ncbi:MAG: RluA family pseudouridine synthase [Candidatus Microsaccharimonas sossegonensis]|uniref:Pseudouridine synthase n=1 Tax=Candidatus Microsaccharimonas sossegonensis TaxID=2506948 RepID=A0A4Q0AID5_9BACT|nr:MAG: RluA family pseudouridine synthase [Candidatus Microsaccharimonas sossegonensis]
MSKTLTRDIRVILRQFEIAGELTSTAEIMQSKEVMIRQGVKLITCVFEKTRYYVLIDGHADDDKSYILEQIQTIDSEVVGHVVKNPLDTSHTTYGMPFKGKDAYVFKVTTPKRRLDHELAIRYPKLSRSTLQKYIKAGHVKVDGVVVTRPKQEVLETDDIAMIPPEYSDFSEQDLPIVYIDDNVIVINKPSGMLTHSKGVMNDEFTVADFFRRYTTFGLETSRPGIVHRLDRDTSGVIIGARHDEAADMLKKQFAARQVKKEYIAVTEGVPEVLTAMIDLPIGRNPSAPSTFRVDPSGKSAVTIYELLATKENEALVKLWPKTGRTHQLRVHMQYLHTPILGDRIYGNIKTDRMFLHAHTLEIFIPPARHEFFVAPLPIEFFNKFPHYVQKTVL